MGENSELPPTEADLSATHYINHHHPAIISLTKEIIGKSEGNIPTEWSILK